MSRSQAAPRAALRGDIEGLRALAVGLVLVGHAATPYLPGGFVGVDVFFVVSGFLITGLLVEEFDGTGRISLPGFYARRAKRLLPAAGLVLLAALLLTYLFLPTVRFADTAWDVVAGALYVLNWRLADQSVDYLAADQATSIVQHYWSLSVEEQFYLVWPLVVLALLGLAGRHRERVLVGGLTLIAVASFAWSVRSTRTAPEAAYFVTTTRIWELALGATVAVVAVRLGRTPRPVAAVLAWAGLAAVLASAVSFDGQWAFPGYVALLPTVGTAAVLGFAVAAGRAGPAGLLGVAPMRAVGALSYSLYLWHWPLLVVAEHRFGPLGSGAGLAVVAASVVPAVLTHRYVENPIRHSPALLWDPGQALRIGSVWTATAALAGLLFHLTVWPPPPPPSPVPVASGDRVDTTGTAPGAAVLRREPRGDPAGAQVDRVETITPDPRVATRDVPVATSTGCQLDLAADRPRRCVYGDPEGSLTVVLAGDSHATQWLPALHEVAVARRWRVVTHTKVSCPFLAVEVARKGQPYTSCTEWNRRVRAELREDPPDLLLVGSLRYPTVRDGRVLTDRPDERMATALRDTWRQTTRLGIPVVVLRDSPYHRADPVDCVSANPDRLTRCAPPRAEVLAAGGGVAQERAAAGQPGVHLIDLNDAICPTDRCAPIIGGVLVYRDTNHLTASYSRTLAPRLDTALAAVRARID
ncbi:acyltransferase family protein [Micromonospora sp. SH-82]|uniref:acyltransferase family protein n=1 Tax=Micromonospora sp. SH-82 TaxID=3132938 RepID=UPI003EB71D71